MRCFLKALCIVILCMLGAAPAGARQESKRFPRNMILIGWDGAQRNHVYECLERGELPNLARLASEGTLVPIDILRQTDTKAGWTQILTGYEPEKTGVFSNERYRPIPEGYTLFERFEKHFGPDHIFTAAVIGKRANVDCEGPALEPILPPTGKKAKGAGKPEGDANNGKKAKKPRKKQALQGQPMVLNGIPYRMIPGKPYYNAAQHMDLFINGLVLDEVVGEKALALLEEHKDERFFFFIHFAEVDKNGHAHGENSKEYNDAIISADTWTGKVMDKLKELGLYDETLIYVTADHGFDEGMNRHRDAPYVFLATNDAKVKRGGDRVDIAPTLLKRFGVKPDEIDPPLDGRSLTRRHRDRP